MGRRLCCCNITCVIFSDDFIETPGTVLNDDWTEEKGAWEYVSSNYLEENGGAAVDALAATVAESDNTQQMVTADLFQIADGNKHRVCCNLVDEQNYLFAEMTQNAGNTTVRFWKRVGGSNTALNDEVTVSKLDPDTQITLCVSTKSMTWSANPVPGANAFIYYCSPPLNPLGKKAGVGNGGSSTIQFDDFTLANFVGDDGEEPEDRDCCEQQCMCKEGAKEFCMPHQLLMTWEAILGCEPPLGLLDGQTAIMTYKPESNRWETDAGEPSCMADLDTVWYLQCGDPDCLESQPPPPNLVLWAENGNECVNICDRPLTQVCDPFEIITPWFPYAAFDPDPICDPCCDATIDGSWRITIVEYIP